jgi:hypothetical protein
MENTAAFATKQQANAARKATILKRVKGKPRDASNEDPHVTPHECDQSVAATDALDLIGMTSAAAFLRLSR